MFQRVLTKRKDCTFLFGAESFDLVIVDSLDEVLFKIIEGIPDKFSEAAILAPPEKAHGLAAAALG